MVRMRPASRDTVCRGPSIQTNFIFDMNALSWGNGYADSCTRGRSSGGIAIGVSAVVSVCGAHATRIHGVAFSLALMARDACFHRTLALGGRHDQGDSKLTTAGREP